MERIGQCFGWCITKQLEITKSTSIKILLRTKKLKKYVRGIFKGHQIKRRNLIANNIA